MAKLIGRQGGSPLEAPPYLLAPLEAPPYLLVPPPTCSSRGAMLPLQTLGASCLELKQVVELTKADTGGWCRGGAGGVLPGH